MDGHICFVHIPLSSFRLPISDVRSDERRIRRTEKIRTRKPNDHLYPTTGRIGTHHRKAMPCLSLLTTRIGGMNKIINSVIISFISSANFFQHLNSRLFLHTFRSNIVFLYSVIHFHLPLIILCTIVEVVSLFVFLLPLPAIPFPTHPNRVAPVKTSPHNYRKTHFIFIVSICVHFTSSLFFFSLLISMIWFPSAFRISPVL